MALTLTFSSYNTHTILDGLGYQPGTGGKLIYEIFGNFPEPGLLCNTMIRSTASLTTMGYGNLIYQTTAAECSGGTQLEDTFMVQFCCGVGDCTAANVPFKRGIAGHTSREAASSLQGTLTFANGTIIGPLAVGKAPEVAQVSERAPEVKNVFERQAVCASYDGASYIANGDPCLTTKGTQVTSASVGLFPESTTIMSTFGQSVSRTTSFSTSVGDPFVSTLSHLPSEISTNEHRARFCHRWL